MSLVCLFRCVDLLKCRGVILGCVLICLCVWNFPLACLWGHPRPQQWLGRVPGLLCWWHQILAFGGVGFHFPLGCWYHFRATCPWESSTPTPCSCGQVTAWRCGEGAPTISHPYIWSGASSVSPFPRLPAWSRCLHGSPLLGIFGAISDLNTLAFRCSGIPHDFCPMKNSILVF